MILLKLHYSFVLPTLLHNNIHSLSTLKRYIMVYEITPESADDQKGSVMIYTYNRINLPNIPVSSHLIQSVLGKLQKSDISGINARSFPPVRRIPSFLICAQNSLTFCGILLTDTDRKPHSHINFAISTSAQSLNYLTITYLVK